jgi:hypothetical protein
LLVGTKETDLDKMNGYQVSKNIGVFNGTKVDVYGMHNKVIFDAQYTNGGKKNTVFGNLKGIWFDDPWGTGARQAWLGAPADLFGTGESVKPLFTVSFDSDGGTPVPYQLVTQGDYASEPEFVVKEGYKLLCWVDSSNDSKFNFDTAVNGHLVLKATWESVGEPAEYIVKFMVDDEQYGDDMSVKEGELVNKPADPIKDEFKFLGWYLGEAIYNFATPVNGDLILYANFEEVGQTPVVLTATAVLGKDKGTDFVIITVFADGKNIADIKTPDVGKKETKVYTVDTYSVTVVYDNGGKITSVTI